MIRLDLNKLKEIVKRFDETEGQKEVLTLDRTTFLNGDVLEIFREV